MLNGCAREIERAFGNVSGKRKGGEKEREGGNHDVSSFSKTQLTGQSVKLAMIFHSSLQGPVIKTIHTTRTHTHTHTCVHQSLTRVPYQATTRINCILNLRSRAVLNLSWCFRTLNLTCVHTHQRGQYEVDSQRSISQRRRKEYRCEERARVCVWKMSRNTQRTKSNSE